jgi:Flp pilus assembly protein TadD
MIRLLHFRNMHDSIGVWVMVSVNTGNLRRITLPLLLVVSAFAISACQSKTANLESLDGLTTASTPTASFKKTAELGNRWQGDPKNLELGLAYADGLEKLGQTDQQMQVLATLSSQNPQNRNIQALYGKKLLAAGRSGEAIPVLKAVADGGTDDWRVLSALGSAYDQQGQYGTARETYQKALALQPNQISVLNNMGMSYALEGSLKEAEETLRSAMALPEGKSLPRLRQNLALVVGLQGRFEESRKIASEDLPPEEVEANMAYLQKMLSQPNTWQQLSDDPQG